MSHPELHYDAKAILDLLPHRPPFLLLDGLAEVVPGQSATGIKHVRPDDPVFAGHFPGNPIYPGVLVVEAMAQTAVALLRLDPAKKGRLWLFGGVNHMRFKRPVLPGDTLVMRVAVVRVLRSAAIATVSAHVGDALVAQGEIVTGSVIDPGIQLKEEAP